MFVHSNVAELRLWYVIARLQASLEFHGDFLFAQNIQETVPFFERLKNFEEIRQLVRQVFQFG